MVEPPAKKVKIEESFELSEPQQQLIREDTANKKLWDEALDSLKEGPVGKLSSNLFFFSPSLTFRVQMFVSADLRSDLARLRRLHFRSPQTFLQRRTWQPPFLHVYKND